MLTLRVRYREDDGSVSDCVMTHVVPFGDERFSAFLVSDDRMRPAHFDRVVIASDVGTGEVIDVRELCGARPLPGPITARPLRRPRPKGKGRAQSSEALSRQRRRDRDEFFNRYRIEIIWNHFRNQLIGLFNGRCFACDSPEDLQLDHHVPFIHGGRREPGNFVMLCFRCNAQKWDYQPEDFYSADELAHLAPMLAQEEAVLTFEFDSERWGTDPVGYLLDIGVSPLLIHEITTNPDHLWHVPLDRLTG